MNLGDAITKKFTTGRLYFLPVGLVDGYLDFGNVPDYKSDPKVEYLDHQKSALGRKKSDFSCPKSHSEKKTFTLDEEVGQVLIYLFLATQGANSVEASGSVINEAITANSQLGRVYFTVSAGISAVTVRVGETTYANGTDYTYDAISGAITILAGSTIPNGSLVGVDYSFVAVTDLNFAGLNNLLSRGTFKHYEFDQFDTVPRATETFSGQCEVTAWGDNNGDKFTEFTLEVIITPE